MSETVLGWHFAAGDVLGNGDGRPEVVGEWLRVEGPLVQCGNGLHLSARAIDALARARGLVCARVEGRDNLMHCDGEVVCRERRRLWRIDARAVALRFARCCALDVMHLRAPIHDVDRWLICGGAAVRTVPRAAAAWTATWAAKEAAAAWAAAAARTAAARTAAWAAKEAAAAGAETAVQNARLESWLTRAHDGWVPPDRIEEDEVHPDARTAYREAVQAIGMQAT